MGWGIGSWGTSEWGSGVAEELFVVSAFALNTNTVRVLLSRAPRWGRQPGDAGDPSAWAVIAPRGRALTVLAVKRGPTRRHVDLTVLQAFDPFPAPHVVRTATIRTPVGALITAPLEATFEGIAATRPGPGVLSDLRNPPFGSDVQAGGTFSVGANGDYQQHSGEELLRKLLVRRLTTTPGGFFHLPGYGIGLRVKEPLTTQDLTKLRAEIERQLAREPEIDTARVRLTLSPQDGVLVVAVRAILSRTQEQVTVEVPVPTPLAGL